MSAMRALVVGIDAYSGQRRKDGQVFAPLRGSVNDARAFDGYLRDRLGLPSTSIERLLAATPTSGQPAVSAVGENAELPTYRNLIAAFERLIHHAGPADPCVIFFSGHGARATTIIPDAKGPAGIDECLVPLDVGDTDGGYLRDVEVAILLQRLVARGGLVTLILDCCFAAGATRGPVGVRGIAGIDRGAPPRHSRVAGIDALTAHWQRLRGRHARPDRRWTYDPEGYVCLAACRSTESAYEYPFEGREFRGVFTHSLLATLVSTGADGSGQGSFRSLMDQVTARVRQRFEHQAPTLEGDLDRTVWGSGSQPAPPPGVLVLAIDSATRRVRLGAGSAHGLGVGDKLLPTSGGSTASDRTVSDCTVMGRPGLIEVMSVGSVESLAVADARVLAGLEPGDRVAVVEPGHVPALRVACLIREPKSLLTALEHGCRDTPSMLAWVGASFDGQAAEEQLTDRHVADVQVARDDGDAIWVLDPAGARIPHLGTPLLASAPGTACELLRRLQHLYRFRAVASLANPDPPPYLAQGLAVTLGLVSTATPSVSSRVPGAESSPPRHVSPAHVQVGDGLLLRVRNQTTLTLEVAVLDLQPDWGIAQIAPTVRAGSSHPLGPGEAWTVRLRAALPSGIARGRDTIKVLATIAPTRFRWLELPALVATSPDAASPGAAVGTQRWCDKQPATAFEHFLANRLNPQTYERADDAPYVGSDWLVETVSMEIRSEPD